MSDERGPDPQAMNEDDRLLASKVDRLLRDEAGVYAAVRAAEGVVYLDGIVESAAQRDAATDLALRITGVTRVQNDLEIEEFGQPGAATRSDESVYADVGYQMLEADLAQNPQPLRDLAEPDYNEAVPVVGGDLTSDAMIAAEEGIPYVPPTDPVVRPSDDDQQIAIIGGFGTSADDEFPDLSATTALGDAPPGDEDLREEVIEALRANAATAEFVIAVTVRNGTVYLRGAVQTLDDSELAEEVAASVPGVRNVVEELTIAALQ